MLRPGSHLPLALALVSALSVGCSSSDSGGGAAPPTSGVPAGCDPLVPTYCGFPFPSNAHLVDDPATPTGKRVHFTKEMLPRWQHGAKETDPSAWNDADGFSPGGPMMTHFPDATIAGLPTQDTIGDSVKTTSPTIVMEADTGALVPHFAELDMSATTREYERTFFIRPVVRLKDATRYIVAIRHVVDSGGNAIPPTPAFAALRDGTPFGDDEVNNRRANYADIFAKLAAAGIATNDLQIAWDFTTASRDNNTKWMVHMRDDALATVGDAGPKYTIDDTVENPNPHIRLRIHGHMTVPLYLDKGDAGGTLVFGDDGMPKQNGTYDYPFDVNIPNSICDGSPAGILQNGHGLLGSRTEGQNGYLADIADTTKKITVAVNLVGFAEEDLDTVLDLIAGDPGGFKKLVGRQHQGVINELLAMRMMKGSFYKDPVVTALGATGIDPTQAFRRGDSQGGIFGTTYMALTTDVKRGLLGEPGAPYSMLLERSTDFGTYYTLINANFASAFDSQMYITGLLQMLWDRSEPDGYMPYIHDDMLPNTPSHDVLLHVALADHQVTPLGAHIIARAVGAKNLKPVNREIYGIDAADSGFSGSGLVEFNFNLPEAPKTNNPPSSPDDPHDWVRDIPAAIDMEEQFFETGTVNQTCPGPNGEPNTGPCVFPKQ